jgi:hypothetical protein
VAGGIVGDLSADRGPGGDGQLRGIVTDDSGGPLPGATVIVRGENFLRSVTTGSDGSYSFLDLPNQTLELETFLGGFSRRTTRLPAGSGARRLNLGLKVASLSEAVEVTGEAPAVEMDRRTNAPKAIALSANVANLQRRVAGVLPVRIDIPRAGHSYRFARPLVVDEETFLTFKYKAR